MTASRSSTTTSDTWSATNCSSRYRVGSSGACGRPTRSRGWAGMSSPSCWTGSAMTCRPTPSRSGFRRPSARPFPSGAGRCSRRPVSASRASGPSTGTPKRSCGMRTRRCITPSRRARRGTSCSTPAYTRARPAG
ncbi:MAG: hypothetical protein MZV70_19635 [Desulfobacterales bacterium]|nr:hypothetical protein [Desulfobacterales bacterium]